MPFEAHFQGLVRGAELMGHDNGLVHKPLSEWPVGEWSEFQAEDEVLTPPGPSDQEINAQAVAAEVAANVHDMLATSKRAGQPFGVVLNLDSSIELRDVLLGPNILGSPIWSDLSAALALRGTCSFLRLPLRTADFLAQLLTAVGFQARWALLPAARLISLAWHVHAELLLLHDLTQIGMAHGGHCCIAGSYALHRMLLLEERQKDAGFAPGDMDIFISVPEKQRRPAFAAARARLEAFFRGDPGLQRHPNSQGTWRTHAPQPVHSRESNLAYLGEGVVVHEGEARVPIARERALRVLSALGGLSEAERGRWLPALEALPDELGVRRPYALGRVQEIGFARGAVVGEWMAQGDASPGSGAPAEYWTLQLEATGSNPWWYRPPPVTSTCPAVGYLGWVQPLRANLIEVVAAGAPRDAAAIVAPFDMVQCMVAMVAPAASGAKPRFVCSEVARRCAAQRLIKFSRFVFPPCARVRLLPGQTDPLTGALVAGDGELVPWFPGDALSRAAR